MAIIIYLINLKVQDLVAKYPCLTFRSAKTKQSTNHTRSNLKTCFMASTLVIALASCSSPSTKPSKVSDIPAITTETTVDVSSEVTAESLVLTSTEKPLEEAKLLLIAASDKFLKQGKPAKALLLANKVASFYYQQIGLNATESDSFSKAQQQAVEQHLINSQGFQQVVLTQAQAYWQLSNADLANSKASLLSAIDKQLFADLQGQYYKLAMTLALTNNEAVEQLYAQLQYLPFNEQLAPADIESIWQNLVSLADWKVSLLKQKNPTGLTGWLALLTNAQRYGAEPEQLAINLKRWQQQYAQHPAQLISQQLIDATQVNELSLENIAVILPLSGTQKAAGEAAQQGLLAAYQSDEQTTLHFIDSQKLDFDTLSTTLAELNSDYVIGPLLRSNVNKYLAAKDIITPALLLNVPNQPLTSPLVTAFSMRPEDEATQAAAVLSAKNFKHPLILSQRDNVSDRISQAFVKQWQKSTGAKPEIVHFERGQTMQREVTSSLDIAASKARIKDLNARIKYSIKEEARNRRDIDMIYLVGGAQESSLVKPYIDVSISPFSELIPVYASSRSHSAAQEFGDATDLSGLMFTEMPWLLPSSQQEAELAKTVKALWPKRSDGLQRIFAMGYDSFHLVSKLEAMKNQPYIRHYGQTGTLQLTENNRLTRSLIWARYRKDRIETFDID